MGVEATARSRNHGQPHSHSHHRAAGAALLTAGLGATAVGLTGTANADVCWNLPSDGTTYYYYC
jgi:hypothetical protein